jgi:hypothetical protein
MEKSGPRFFRFSHEYNGLRKRLWRIAARRHSCDNMRQIGKRATRPAGRASDGTCGQRIDRLFSDAIRDMEELKRRLSDDASKYAAAEHLIPHCHSGPREAHNYSTVSFPAEHCVRRE